MTIEIVNHTVRPTKIKNFSTKRYVDPEYMEREWANLWRQSWLLAGLESDVREPGDYFVFDIGREQILVTRSKSGSVKGFFNVCQHRGNRLVSEELGHAHHFRCAYHAWTYDTEGALKVIPYENRFPDGVALEGRSLCTVHTDVWNGFVFISMADEPPPLLEFLGPVAD
jgi:phenylpropionate dioxygenase-like ring-hydroxylating dioxygenase large terminal subunit